MNKNDIQRLRELPIESVAERLGLRVTKHKTLCPYHADSHPSLSFSVAKNRFKCFVCDAHGGVIDLAMQVLNKPFREACEWLANEHNVIIEQYAGACAEQGRSMKQVKHYPPDVQFLSGLVARPVLNDSARHFLFEKRRLNPKVIEWCGISSISYPTPCWRYGKPFYDAPSLLFPYKDINGNVLNVQSRYLGTPETGDFAEHVEGKPSETRKSIPRFRFPPNGAIHIFNLPILRYLKPGEPLYISEGITDCLALLSSGHKAIAIPSATLLKAEDLQILSTLNTQLSTLNLHIYPDKDAAGERLYNRLVSVATSLGSSLQRHDLPTDCKDYSDFYVQRWR